MRPWGDWHGAAIDNKRYSNPNTSASHQRYTSHVQRKSRVWPYKRDPERVTPLREDSKKAAVACA